MSFIRLVVVDGRPVRRMRLTQLLEQAADITVVARCDHLSQATQAVMRHAPCLLLLDGALTDAVSYHADAAALQALGAALIPIWDYPDGQGDIARTAMLQGDTAPLDLEHAPERLALLLRTIHDTHIAQTALRNTDQIAPARPGPRVALRISETGPNLPDRPDRPARVLAIGASTGGVQALLRLVPDLGADCPPTLIVQHMPGRFLPSFAARLDTATRAQVRIAEHGDRLETGHIYVAPGDATHLELAPGSPLRLSLRQGPKHAGHRPSVDMLFQSLTVLGADARCALLTGMGADGAEGLAAVRAAGGWTLAQDEATCTVFGMPREAIARDAACAVLPLDHIATALIQSGRTSPATKHTPATAPARTIPHPYSGAARFQTRLS